MQIIKTGSNCSKTVTAFKARKSIHSISTNNREGNRNDKTYNDNIYYWIGQGKNNINYVMRGLKYVQPIVHLFALQHEATNYCCNSKQQLLNILCETCMSVCMYILHISAWPSWQSKRVKTKEQFKKQYHKRENIRNLQERWNWKMRC